MFTLAQQNGRSRSPRTSGRLRSGRCTLSLRHRHRRVRPLSAGRAARPPSPLEHAHHVRRPRRERVVRLRFAAAPGTGSGRARELEAVARMEATARVVADVIELQPALARRARLQHQQLAALGIGPPRRRQQYAESKNRPWRLPRGRLLVRVLGVDPGLGRTGVALVEGRPGALRLIHVSCIETAALQLTDSVCCFFSIPGSIGRAAPPRRRRGGAALLLHQPPDRHAGERGARGHPLCPGRGRRAHRRIHQRGQGVPSQATAAPPNARCCGCARPCSRWSGSTAPTTPPTPAPPPSATTTGPAFVAGRVPEPVRGWHRGWRPRSSPPRAGWRRPPRAAPVAP